MAGAAMENYSGWSYAQYNNNNNFGSNEKPYFSPSIRVFTTLLVGPVFPGVNIGNWLYLMVMTSRVKIYFFFWYMNVFGS